MYERRIRVSGSVIEQPDTVSSTNGVIFLTLEDDQLSK